MQRFELVFFISEKRLARLFYIVLQRQFMQPLKKNVDEQLTKDEILIEKPPFTRFETNPVNGNYNLPDEEDEEDEKEDDLILGDEELSGDEEEYDVELEDDIDEKDLDDDDLVIDADEEEEEEDL